MGMVVIGAVFVDIKGYPTSAFIPTGRNAGRVEQIHGGVGRNVAEDIANCELRPTFVSLVDDSGTGVDVVRKLKSHRVNTDYIRKTRNGMGTWLAVFNDDGDVAASISQRPNLLPIAHTLEQDGIYVSTGSACSSNHASAKGSHVLNAMGLSPKEIEGAIRFSFSEFNTIEEMEYTAEKLKAAVQRFRRLGSFR